MKILIYGINHTPELIGIGKYTGEMVKWLAEQGHEVKVVTAPPYYPDWKVSDGYSSAHYKREVIDGASVLRCPLWVPKEVTGTKRIIHLFSFAFFSFPPLLWYSIFWRPAIVFVVEPAFFCLPGALISATLCRARSWLHIQDFEIDAAFELGILKSQRLKRWIIGFESWVMRRFDRVTTISVRMLDKVRQKGVSEQRMSLFENWVDTEFIRPVEHESALYRELNLPENRKILLYSGNMGEKQGLELLLNAAEVLKDRHDILFLLCGDGSSKERLVSLSGHLDNVIFIGLQPLENLNKLLNLADVHLLPQKAGAEDLVMPSKLTNMLSSGRPVIATAMPETQIANVLKECGLIVEPEDLGAFVAAINTLIDDDEMRHFMGENGREFVQKHWDIDKVLSNAFSKC